MTADISESWPSSFQERLSLLEGTMDCYKIGD